MKKKKIPIDALGERKNARYLDGDPFTQLSISLPAEMKPLIVQRAVGLRFTVSEYIRWLIDNEIVRNPLKV